MPETSAPRLKAGLGPVVAAWLLLTAITQLPYVRAAVAAPPGRYFVGFFYFVDDHYNYLSFVQQAEDGRFLFRNKLVLDPHPGALVNLEWWLVGRLSALLGRRPLLAYHVFGMAASFALVLAVDFWLRRGGLPVRHRFSALLLVLGGGGLGGAVYLTGALPSADAIDLWTGLFPFAELLFNPHFVAGTALLLWTLAALIEGRSWTAVALGSALAVTRPYDFVLVVAIRAAGVLLTEPPRRWLRSLLPLVAFAPAAAYLFWIFYRNLAFAFYAATPYGFPSRSRLALALGPPLVLAAFSFRAPGDTRWTRHLVVWGAAAALVVISRPVHFSLQFLVGIGVPLLSLGALALSRRGPGALVAAAVLMSGTALASLRIVMAPTHPRWHVPSAHLETVRRLGTRCQPGDIAMLPIPIGLYAGGLTACHPYTSHPIEPDHASRTERTRWFYGAASPDERERFLDGICARLVVDEGGAVHERPRRPGCGRALD